MKKIFRTTLMFSLLLSMTSCFDIVEEITIKEDGSGNYSTRMDLMKVMDLITKMGDPSKPNSEDKFKELKEKKDTVIYFKDVLDNQPDLSLENKQLLEKGSMHMKMNFQEKEFFFDIIFPFKNGEELTDMYKNSSNAFGAAKVGDLIKGKSDKNGDTKNNKIAPGLGSTPGNDMFASNNYSTLTLTNNSFERKIDVNAYKAHLEKDTSMKMMSAMFGATYVTTIIHLPRPAKKVENPLAELSEDKMTVKLKYPFSDYFERPNVMNIKVEY